MWACPGTSSWRSLTGRTAERRGNIDAAARCHAAEGFLTCDWGDSGHWQVWPVALLGIADGLSAAWSGPGAPSTAALSLHLFGDRTPATAEWLGALGDLDLPLRKVAMPLSRPGVAGAIRNQSALFADLFQPWDAHRDVGTSALAAGVRERLTWLAKSMPSPPDPLVRDELAHTLDMVDVALDRFTLRRGWASPAPADRLARRWADAKDRHAHLWLRRSRPGGLTHSTPFFDKVTFA
jgi:hexosaminidase